MKQEIKDKWVADLRSGEYKQGRAKLRYDHPGNGSQYCCLGVLCIQAEAAGIVEWVPPGEIGAPYGYAAAGADPEDRGLINSTLPYAVTEWAGLDRPDPVVDCEDGGRRSLAGLNDDRHDFAEIAGYIEEQL